MFQQLWSILHSFEGRLSLPSLSIGQALKVCILLSCLLLTHLERQAALVLGRPPQTAAGRCISARGPDTEWKTLAPVRVGILFMKHMQGLTSVPRSTPQNRSHFNDWILGSAFDYYFGLSLVCFFSFQDKWKWTHILWILNHILKSSFSLSSLCLLVQRPSRSL